MRVTRLRKPCAAKHTRAHVYIPETRRTATAGSSPAWCPLHGTDYRSRRARVTAAAARRRPDTDWLLDTSRLRRRWPLAVCPLRRTRFVGFETMA